MSNLILLGLFTLISFSSTPCIAAVRILQRGENHLHLSADGDTAQALFDLLTVEVISGETPKEGPRYTPIEKSFQTQDQSFQIRCVISYTKSLTSFIGLRAVTPNCTADLVFNGHDGPSVDGLILTHELAGADLEKLVLAVGMYKESHAHRSDAQFKLDAGLINSGVNFSCEFLRGQVNRCYINMQRAFTASELGKLYDFF